jgi:tripartite-type tricarboxylate transporter receptor subunit TctC
MRRWSSSASSPGFNGSAGSSFAGTRPQFPRLCSARLPRYPLQTILRWVLIMTTRRSVASLATTATAALALTSAASAFPDKLLQFVTPYPFGGSHALHASIITTAAEPHFGQPMISVIRTGGGGVVGADYVLKSAADGHVMLFGDPNLNSLRPQVEQLSFSVGDFIPVARINYSPWVFVAKPDAPFGGTIKGMADWAKANPDKLIYSSDNVNGLDSRRADCARRRVGARTGMSQP